MNIKAIFFLTVLSDVNVCTELDTGIDRKRAEYKLNLKLPKVIFQQLNESFNSFQKLIIMKIGYFSLVNWSMMTSHKTNLSHQLHSP